MDTDDNPWDDNPAALPDTEWARLSSDFVNAGYREGITAGKEGALQAGFDDGFAHTGAPLGRDIGLLRGAVAALHAFLASARPLPPASGAQDGAEGAGREAWREEARAIAAGLGAVRFSDIAPRDEEAEAHAREHLAADADEGADVPEEVQAARDVESLEDMMARMGAGAAAPPAGRPTMEDVARLEERLRVLAGAMGLAVPSR